MDAYQPKSCRSSTANHALLRLAHNKAGTVIARVEFGSFKRKLTSKLIMTSYVLLV